MFSRDNYLNPVLNNASRLLGLLNRNISSSSYGCFDREFWHYNTADIACARKQEAVLTFTLLYLIDHENNTYYHRREILEYIRAAMVFWTKIQNKNGSFNEWYPNEHSFVVTSFSAYAVSESLLLLKEEIPKNEYQLIVDSLSKAGNWLLSRNETRVMNQQTGAAIALLNLYLLTNESRYLDSSKDKISLLHKRQSKEGWFIEYGGPDIGYLSLAIDYLSKYYLKTGNEDVKEIICRALNFIKYFIQPNMIAGGEYTSRNTEYLIPHGFEVLSRTNEDAFFAASAVRKKIVSTDAFPRILDDRYLTYNGYTWLQAYLDANPELDNSADETVNNFFKEPFRKFYGESGMLISNDEHKHFIVNVKKGGAFRLYDKKTGKTYSDSGILVKSGGKWYTSGWLAEGENHIADDVVSVSGNMWKVPDKTLTTGRYVLLRLFQMVFGRSSYISLWMKERLRDILITKTSASAIKFRRKIVLNADSADLFKIKDTAGPGGTGISSISVFSKDTHIYVPSSRYYSGTKEPPFTRTFSEPAGSVEVDWKIGRDGAGGFTVH